MLMLHPSGFKSNIVSPSGDHRDGDVMTKWLDNDAILRVHERDITCFHNNPAEGALEFLINLIILYAKFLIHKHKFSKSDLTFVLFLMEFKMLLDSLKVINKKNKQKKSYHTSPKTICYLISRTVF